MAFMSFSLQNSFVLQINFSANNCKVQLLYSWSKHTNYISNAKIMNVPTNWVPKLLIAKPFNIWFHIQKIQSMKKCQISNILSPLNNHPNDSICWWAWFLSPLCILHFNCALVFPVVWTTMPVLILRKFFSKCCVAVNAVCTKGQILRPHPLARLISLLSPSLSHLIFSFSVGG